MFTQEQIYHMKATYIYFMASIGMLNVRQKQNLDSLIFDFESFRSGNAAGSYDPNTNTMALNLNYTNSETLILTFFHELDHCRTRFKHPDGTYGTGFWNGFNNCTVTRSGNVSGICRGEMVGEGLAAINGERAYRYYRQLGTWEEIPKQTTDRNLFKGHSFPSGLWWYKLNGNFISQAAAILGVKDNEFCKLADDNLNGRAEIQKRFRHLTDADNYFNSFETTVDYVASVAKVWLTMPIQLSSETMLKCDSAIKTGQHILYLALEKAYQDGKVNQDEFVKRFNKFNSYTTTNTQKMQLANDAASTRPNQPAAARPIQQNSAWDTFFQ